MKRFLITTALLVLCIASPASMGATSIKSSVDMRDMKRIFVGWVNLHPEAFATLDYSSKADWEQVIQDENAYFLSTLTTFIPGRTFTMAKNSDDENTTGNDLYIKFSDVSEDLGYRLHIAVHFINLKTNQEIVMFPVETYGAHVCGLESCIQKELKKVEERIDKAVNSPPGTKL